MNTYHSRNGNGDIYLPLYLFYQSNLFADRDDLDNLHGHHGFVSRGL